MNWKKVGLSVAAAMAFLGGDPIKMLNAMYELARTNTPIEVCKAVIGWKIEWPGLTLERGKSNWETLMREACTQRPLEALRQFMTFGCNEPVEFPGPPCESLEMIFNQPSFFGEHFRPDN